MTLRPARECSRCGPTTYRREIPPGARRARFPCEKCGCNTKSAKRPRTKSQTFAEASKTWKELDVEALRLWSLVVRARDPICRGCRVKPSTQAHHLISRGRPRYRYDVTNGVGLCGGCHTEVTHDGHENRRLAIEILGEAEWEHRQILKRLPYKADPSMAIFELRQMLNGEAVTR